MIKTLLALSVATMSLCLVSAAGAAELPTDSVCHIAAEAAYDAAVAAGDGLPDGAYESTMGACEDAEEATLNDLVAIDGEAWLPVCQFDGTCRARQADAMLAPVLAMLAR